MFWKCFKFVKSGCLFQFLTTAHCSALSLKLRRNLPSFRWLESKLSQLNNLISSELWIQNTKFIFSLMKYIFEFIERICACYRYILIQLTYSIHKCSALRNYSERHFFLHNILNVEFQGKSSSICCCLVCWQK